MAKLPHTGVLPDKPSWATVILPFSLRPIVKTVMGHIKTYYRKLTRFGPMRRLRSNDGFISLRHKDYRDSVMSGLPKIAGL
jgi:hypothetical protein